MITAQIVPDLPGNGVQPDDLLRSHQGAHEWARKSRARIASR